MKFYKRIISVFLVIAIISFLGIPALAVDSSAIVGALEVAPDFGSWLWSTMKGTVNTIGSFISDDVCPGSFEEPGYDFRHNFVPKDTIVAGKAGTFYVCSNCGKSAGEVLEPAYDEYVQELPATGYDSSGGLLWSPDFSYMRIYVYGSYENTRYAYCPHSTEDKEDTITDIVPSYDCEHMAITLWPLTGKNSFSLSGISCFFADTYPIAGHYTRISSPSASGTFLSGSLSYTVEKTYEVENSANFHNARESFSFSNSFQPSGRLFSCQYLFAQLYAPVYKVVPFVPVSSDTYNINTRPTSIQGGNYGIIGDNGQITKIEDNSTIVNETNNTYYNPATGTTVPIVNWSYDYSDRSYKVTLDGGKTSTITYGDENISIVETTINESGDTITNNYIIYYLVNGSGSQNPPCEHDWQPSTGTLPTCTVPGSAVSVCSKCQQTKTDPLPALGHDWKVKQTVTTQYDDTGQLVQQGYTIFECSRCGEQRRSDDGTVPPGGGSGTDPGGDEEDEGFLSWLFGKIGELLGTVGSGILNLLKTALDKIFGGLIDLVTALFENLTKLVDLFGSVGEAFQVLWTWLPPEVTAILVAGVSIFVFVALLKFFMK